MLALACSRLSVCLSPFVASTAALSRRVLEVVGLVRWDRFTGSVSAGLPSHHRMFFPFVELFVPFTQ